MTKEDYLSSRGWAYSDHNFNPADEGGWFDSVEGGVCAIDDALIIQRARDASEVRAAWVQFAAARLAWGGVEPSGDGHFSSVQDAARDADAMLDEYRKRTGAGPEVE